MLWAVQLIHKATEIALRLIELFFPIYKIVSLKMHTQKWNHFMEYKSGERANIIKLRSIWSEIILSELLMYMEKKIPFKFFLVKTKCVVITVDLTRFFLYMYTCISDYEHTLFIVFPWHKTNHHRRHLSNQVMWIFTTQSIFMICINRIDYIRFIYVHASQGEL